MLAGSVLLVYQNVTPGSNVGWVSSPRVSECYTGPNVGWVCSPRVSECYTTRGEQTQPTLGPGVTFLYTRRTDPTKHWILV